MGVHDRCRRAGRHRRLFVFQIRTSAHSWFGGETPLPLAPLPQGELLTINENNIPLIPDTLGPGIHVKPLRLDLEEGCWVVLATFSPGAQLPVHYHTGVAEVYTLPG